jgi:hypothetical protein
MIVKWNKASNCYARLIALLMKPSLLRIFNLTFLRSINITSILSLLTNLEIEMHIYPKNNEYKVRVTFDEK